MPPSLAQAPYAVELLFATRPEAQAEQLRAALEARVGRLSMTGGEAGGPVLFSFEDLEAEGVIPQLVFAPNPGPPSLERFSEAVSHTRDWDEAELALTAVRASAYLTDFLAGGVPRATRLRVLVSAAATLCELLPVLAVHWAPAGKLADPRAIVAAASDDPLEVALNVRAFRVEGHLPGELFLDTLGLAALGVPDLQCRFVGLSAEYVASRLRRLAHVAWASGALDGEVQGLRGERWSARPGVPLSAPEREVVDVEPALPFSARGGEA